MHKGKRRLGSPEVENRLVEPKGWRGRGGRRGFSRRELNQDSTAAKRIREVRLASASTDIWYVPLPALTCAIQTAPVLRTWSIVLARRQAKENKTVSLGRNHSRR